MPFPFQHVGLAAYLRAAISAMFFLPFFRMQVGCTKKENNTEEFFKYMLTSWLANCAFFMSTSD